MYKIISKAKEVEFDEEITDVNDEDEKNFIRRLLNVIPETRLHGGYANLMSIPYFKNVDWVYDYLIIFI